MGVVSVQEIHITDGFTLLQDIMEEEFRLAAEKVPLR